MTLEELLAALRAVIDAASAEGRDLTAEEADQAEDLAELIERAKGRQAVLTRSQPVTTLRRLHADFRAEVEVTGKVLRGHAAVFGAAADLGRAGWEDLAPGFFDDVLARPGLDVRALRDHNPSMVLGRTKSGTLRLGVDSTGLEFENDLPNTSYANDLRELVARGDVTGASFGFVPGTDVLTRAADGRTLRTHTSAADLLDVSPVTYPAYEGTDVVLRHRNLASAAPQPPVRLIRAKARLLIGSLSGD